jgi:hypothetical protein
MEQKLKTALGELHFTILYLQQQVEDLQNKLAREIEARKTNG